jgi:hypothetical protein
VRLDELARRLADQRRLAAGQWRAEPEQLVVELLGGRGVIVVAAAERVARLGVVVTEGAAAAAAVASYSEGACWVGEGVFKGGAEGLEVIGGRGEGEIGEAVDGVAKT